MIQQARIRLLNERPPAEGDYVLYWMQQSQRASFNPALECAIEAANQRGLPVVVGFGLTDAYPEANRRHYAFMLQGLQQVEQSLRGRGIGFVIWRGDPAAVALALAARAALLVCDRGYLRHQRQWRTTVARAAPCQVLQVEGDVVVPVEEVSNRQEVGARTLRPKLHRVWDAYLSGQDEAKVVRGAEPLELRSEVDLSDVDQALDRLESRCERRPGATLSGRHRRGARAPRRLPRRRPRRLCPGPERARRLPLLPAQPLSALRPDLAGRDRAPGARGRAGGEAIAPPTSRS